jgi:spermidine synthase
VRLRLAITLFFLVSGATALVYQVIWVRMLGLVVGHSIYAVSTVVATYMAGLGLGARLAGNAAERVPRPLVGYGALEVGIGLFALASPLVLSLCDAVVGLGGGEGSVAVTLLAAMVALLIPTTLMGATLPLITRWYARDEATLGRDMGWLYAVNTTGAFLGAGLAGFGLLPFLGQPASLHGAAAVNIVVGLGAMALGSRVALAPSRAVAAVTEAEREVPITPAVARAVLLSFSLSGAAALVNQVAWARSFGLFTGSTTYAFSLIVCAFIAGLALGGHLFARIVDRATDRPGLLGLVNLGIALSCALLIPIQGWLPLWLIEPIAARAGSFGATQVFVFGVLFALILLPTLLMGGTYTVTTRALSGSPDDAPRMVGRAYAWNTAGAIVGSLGGGMVLIPWLQLSGALWAAVALNLAAAAAVLGSRSRLAWALPLLALLGATASTPWNPRIMNLAPHMYARDLAGNPDAIRRMTDSGSIRFHEEGVGATVTVIQRETGARVLRINGKTDASTLVDRLTQGVVGSLPALLADAQDDALVIGLGSGMTLAATLDHPLQSVDVVELLPEVIAGARQFGELMEHPLDDPRVHLHLGDGRHWVERTEHRYDVVSSQPTNMFVSGISTLFTAEAFQAMRDALEPGGVALVWVQGYLLRDEDFRTVLRTFLEVFPEAHFWNAGPYDFALTGHLAPLELDPERLDARIRALRGTRTELWTGLRGVEDLQRHYLAGPARLRALAGELEVHTDRDPFLEFRAPRGLYGGEDLLDVSALLAAREPLPLPDVSPELREALANRLATTKTLDRVSLAGSVQELIDALRLDPGHPFARIRLARTLHGRALEEAQRGDLVAAERDARHVLDLEPLALQTWKLLATAELVAGHPADAAATLRSAVAHQPWNPYAHLALAEGLEAAGDVQGAAAARDAARSLDPELPELRR